MTLTARVDDLTSPAVRELIAEHLRGMHGNSPPGHVNALAVEALQRQDVTFWTIHDGDMLCGCAAMKELDGKTGEVKSMRTREAFLRSGVGQFALDAVMREASRRRYATLYLETGTGAAFEPAHKLYLRNGFEWCGAFGDYEATAFNVFMKKEIG